MPSDSNGVYSLPNGYLATTGDTIQASQHNPPLEDIATAITGRMMRSGATPMTGPLKIANGAVSGPGLAFNSASGTGFYKTTNGFGVAIDGVQVAEFTGHGMASGSRFLGELIPYAGSTAPGLTVLPYGQTLNRADYPDFWTFVQAEIAAGNTAYNNGNGSTTFGILDMRGRAPFGDDNMGGTAANRITSGGSGIAGTTLGAAGGTETVTLTQAQLPATAMNTIVSAQFPATNVSLNRGNRTFNTQSVGDDSRLSNSMNGGGITDDVRAVIPATNCVIGGTLGSGSAHSNMPPSLICNYLLFVGA